MVGKRVVISGRVQGVGFRAFVAEQAERLGIVGEVWNTRSGDVEAIAQHENVEVLNEFMDALHRGPGTVRTVQSFDDDSAPCLDFRIGPTR
jgi:acylphosphatase